MYTAALRASGLRRQRTRPQTAIFSLPAQNHLKKINIILGVAIVLVLLAQAILMNHLNTVSFRLDDLAGRQAVLMEENGKLQSTIVEKQSLEELQKQAEALGMVAVGDYRFIATGVSAVAQR